MDDSVQHRGSSGAGTSAGGASDDTRYQEMPDDMAAEDAQAGEGAEGAATTPKRKHIGERPGCSPGARAVRCRQGGGETADWHI